MVKVVLDTNVLINADRGAYSHPKRILDLVRWGEIEALMSDPVKREKQLILGRLVKDDVLRGAVKEYFARARNVAPVSVEVAIEDDEDRKLLELAYGGAANFLVTDDEHLLSLGEFQGTQIVRPSQFWAWWQKQQDDQGATWASWAKNIFN